MDAGELLMMVSGNKVKKRQAERSAATQQRVRQRGSICVAKRGLQEVLIRLVSADAFSWHNNISSSHKGD